MPDHGIDHHFGKRNGEVILGAHLIQVSEVDANPDLPILFSDRDDVGKPGRILDFPNEANLDRFVDFGDNLVL